MALAFSAPAAAIVDPTVRLYKQSLTKKPSCPLRHPGGPDRAQQLAPPESGIEPTGATDGRVVEHEATPLSSHEDVMRRARELRERQRETASVGEERHG